MKTVPRENGSNPCIAPMIGSVMAIRGKGARYACHPVRFAPANRLIAPTGARFGGCGSTRNTAPIVVKVNAGHFERGFIIVLVLSYFTRRRQVGLPQCFRNAKPMAHPSAPDKKRVARPVEIPDRFGRNLLLARQRHRDPLRTPADRAADMQ